MRNERLEDLVKPERLQQIKEEHVQRLAAQSQQRSNKLLDILEVDEAQGYAARFI